jgi:prophage regulatory protein
MFNSQTTPTNRVIRLPEIKAQTGQSRSTIYDKLNPKSPRYDATFPKPIKLGARSIGWIEAEVQAWIESRRVTGA